MYMHTIIRWGNAYIIDALPSYSTAFLVFLLFSVNNDNLVSFLISNHILLLLHYKRWSDPNCVRMCEYRYMCIVFIGFCWYCVCWVLSEGMKACLLILATHLSSWKFPDCFCSAPCIPLSLSLPLMKLQWIGAGTGCSLSLFLSLCAHTLASIVFSTTLSGIRPCTSVSTLTHLSDFSIPFHWS